MSFLLQNIRKKILTVPDRQVEAVRTKYHDYETPQGIWLKNIGNSFFQGYHIILKTDNYSQMREELNQFDDFMRGFAFEGAGMSLKLLDILSFHRHNHFSSFLKEHGKKHIYTMYVGFGLAFARLHIPINSALKKLHPKFMWLAVDGYGFYEGSFRWPRYAKGKSLAPHLRGYAQRAFDQGLGRSLWFVKSGNIEEIAKVIKKFPTRRQQDFWSGAGFACTYAGKVDDDKLHKLLEISEPHRSHLLQGAVFAAIARTDAGLPAANTNRVCQIFLQKSPEEVFQKQGNFFIDLDHGKLDAREEIKKEKPAYEEWRRSVQESF